MPTRDRTRVSPPTALSAAAALPYVGTWSMNPDKSDLNGTTITFESLSTDEWQCSRDGMTYRFRIDGKDHATGMGDTAGWDLIDDKTWQTTWKSNEGRILSVETLTLAADGSMLTISNNGTTPNGESIDDSTTFRRLAGASGLEGRWVSTSVRPGPPWIIEFIPAGDDHLTFRQPAWAVMCEARLDGQDHPCVTPLGSGWTMAMSKASALELMMVVKKDGRPVLNMTFRVSNDGNTLTQVSETSGTNEKTRIVYDRRR
jgi:hypothetical protein